MSDIYENDTDESVVEERAPREVDERKDDYRPSDAFIPQSLLPTPIPQDGWVFRWVRTQILGASDNINVSTRFREGWEPVLAEDHPELKFNLTMVQSLLRKVTLKSVVYFYVKHQHKQ